MTVINFTGHKQYVCDSNCNGCQFCHGGLFSCVRCNSFEGATTTDCPGRPMVAEEVDEVYKGTLDYRQAAGGWVQEASPHSPYGIRERK